MDERLNLSADLGYYALAAILIAGMIAFGNRTYKKEYLSRWSLAFLLIGLANVVGYALVRRSLSGEIPSWTAVVVGVLAGAVIWSVLRGAFEMAVRRPPALPLSRALLLGAVLSGVATAAAIWLVHDSAWRPLAAMNGAVLGVAALLSAFMLGWERRRRMAPGFLVCSAALTLMGVGSVLDVARILSGSLDSWLFPLVLFSIVLSGCSVLLFAVEDERQAALLAATQIEHIAYYDPLTGLANRSLFLDRLIAITSIPTATERAAVVFIDIDHFKQINDTYGHSIGDVVLRTLAGRIRNALRRSDMAARYAGDEFIVLIEDLKAESDVHRVGEKLLACLEGPVLTGGSEIRVSGTIGISIYPSHGTSAEDLIRGADAAMYRAKQDGRNRYGVFSPGNDAPVRPQAELEGALRRAIDEEQLSVLYQPIMSLADGTVQGVEAFVRWHDDVLGAVPPSEFIPVAESSSLIGPLGELVLHMVCRDVARWREEIQNRTFFVAVNLSPEQFVDTELISRCRRAISRWNVDPGSLQFEVSESIAMVDLQKTGRILESLRELGVKVALDHFGVGQLSLSHLALFPIEVLKLDRTLISGQIGTRQYGIFRAAAGIAERLGKTVTVEGIETTSQRDLAAREGCELGQGYLFGSPTTADAIRNLLDPHPGQRSPEVEQRDLDSEIMLVSEKASKPTPKPTGLSTVTFVADDDERMRNLMAILLRRVGHDVKTAEDGETLLESVADLDPSQVRLIVLDLMMPRVNGWEVIAHLSETSPELLPKILLVTAAGSHEISKIDTSLYGGVLEKPFDQADFYESAAKCVSGGDAMNGRPGENDGPYAVH